MSSIMLPSSPGSLYASPILAEYALGLRLEALPADVVRRAKDCLIDAVGAACYGRGVAAGQAALRYSEPAQSGPCAILGEARRVDAASAAFANGILTHAAELDSLRQPGSGVHPGAVLVPAAVAAAQRNGASGREVLTALVAGIEVLFRVGNATKHSAESRGFHAPGLTGPFGAAVAAGVIGGVSAAQMSHALGIAGSLGGGLLAFAKAGEGGMVKRIHLGRAAQAGLHAVDLARAGFDGPAAVLEGPFGFLQAFCPEAAPERLTQGLGTDYETLTLCLKRYACHIVAHTPIYAAQQLRRLHGIDAARITAIDIQGAPRLAANHDIKTPGDAVLAQYSVPFCVAAALLHDADDPDTFSRRLLGDPAVRALAQRVRIGIGEMTGLVTSTVITLEDGTQYERVQRDFPGCPSDPMGRPDIHAKFMRLTHGLGDAAAELFERLDNIERETDLHWLDAMRRPS